ncbi:hypothetical protein LshimejAT787_1005750 [Lyophyllum shimeji]|uniref:Uncharacterized protein n=1 Tax=Lyophyllum shimeji TaxID=47721 RepID=A0A9P3PU10_LYOSH|nr:hypothetical protein LshimejAT787_1005750 [Lyophyllum shimeji]
MSTAPLSVPAPDSLHSGPRTPTSGLCTPFLGYVGFRITANHCATGGRPQLYSFYRYYTVPQATGSIVHIARAPGKGSLDLFSLDLPLPASCEPTSVQGSPLQVGLLVSPKNMTSGSKSPCPTGCPTW